jgi:hypothetical protein
MREIERAERAHEIATFLEVPFAVAWKVANCVCKAYYRTEGDAAKAAGEANVRWENKVKPYRCPICGRWHLTSDEEA